MSSSSSCQEDPETGTPEHWDMDEWVAATRNINEKLKRLEKDNDETVQEIGECFGTLTDEVCQSRSKPFYWKTRHEVSFIHPPSWRMRAASFAGGCLPNEMWDGTEIPGCNPPTLSCQYTQLTLPTN